MAASAGSVNGVVEGLHDGDSFEIAGQRIRLKGIDAPEISQSCSDQRRREYACGQRAADFLRALINKRPLHCAGDEFDNYGRLLAICRVGGLEINREMVSAGWAVAYRRYDTRYVAEEEQASLRQQGIWQGVFERPWRYRQAEWQQAERKVAVDDGECVIKGNINARGDRIYHTPWGSKHYKRTKVSLRHGERWFCSESEALASGWRAPYN